MRVFTCSCVCTRVRACVRMCIRASHWVSQSRQSVASVRSDRSVQSRQSVASVNPVSQVRQSVAQVGRVNQSRFRVPKLEPKLEPRLDWIFRVLRGGPKQAQNRPKRLRRIYVRTVLKGGPLWGHFWAPNLGLTDGTDRRD